MSLKVHSVFTSIQGEGMWTGFPMTFVRLHGCNLDCSFCDTPQAKSMYTGGAVCTAVELAVKLCGAHDPRVVCITGGEPTLQLEPLKELIATPEMYGHHFHLETNGSIPLTAEDCSYFTWITLSPKPPLFEVRLPWSAVGEVKLVIGEPGGITENEVVRRFRGLAPPHVPIWLQPNDNRQEAIETCLSMIRTLTGEFGPLQIGLSVQLHKLIGVE